MSGQPVLKMQLDMLRDQATIQVQHRYIMPVADQAAGELAADISQADKSDFHKGNLKTLRLDIKFPLLWQMLLATRNSNVEHR